jgi:RNA polymerase sigma factor (sigma-70 family)
MSILAHDMEVEDAMQSAYISAYENLNKFGFRSSFSTWLTRIMLNECLGRKKKRVKYKTDVNHQPENQITMATPANILVNKELSGVLENAIGQLPDKYRLVFVLREIEEMSVRDTSEALDIEEANVKTRLNRAKSMLRDSLSGYMKDNIYAFNLVRCDRIVNNVLAHLKIA